MVATSTEVTAELDDPGTIAPTITTNTTTSIKVQLRQLVLVTTSLALLLAYLAFVGYDLMTYRESIATKLTLLADVTAGNTFGALAFQDREAAGQALATLSADPQIEYAALLDMGGQLFAQHARSGVDSEEIMRRWSIGEIHATATHITVTRPITLKGERIGTIVLYASLAEQTVRLRRFAGIGALILLFSFAASWALSSRLPAAIINPIRDLTRLVGQLSAETGFSVRVRTSDIRIEEIQVLASGFNDMLAALQSRDAQLRTNEERLSAALLGSGQGMWDWELSSDEIFFDDQARTLVGFKPAAGAEAFGFETGRVHPEDISKLRDAHAACMSGATGVFEVECRIPGENNDWRWVEIGGKVVARDETGAPSRLAGTFQDVNDRKQQQAEQDLLQARLQHSQKIESLGQLTGGIAHDFNNLLSIITGNLQLLEHRVDDEQNELVQPALSAALRGGELTGRLLTYARRQDLEPRTVVLNELLPEMTSLFNKALGEDIVIKTVLHESLWPITVDPGQLENAVLNLVINARDAMPDGGTLTIETSNVTLDSDHFEKKPDLIPGDYVLLSVSDTGTGIAPDVLKQVYDPFFTTKDVGKGTGLGLSMVWGFVDQSGGHVDIDSKLGHGTCAKIYLPRSGAALEGDDENLDGECVEGGDEIILVVDDDDDVRATAVRLLRDYGYEVLEAHDATAALLILDERDDIDLLFTDVIMPGIRGPILAEMARTQRPDMRVLFTSGYTESAVMYCGKIVDSARLLFKPYIREELVLKIRSALSKGV